MTMPRRLIFTGVPSYQQVAQSIPDFIREDQEDASRTIPETFSEGELIREVKDSFEATVQQQLHARTVKVPLRPPQEPGVDVSPLPTLSYLSWRRVGPLDAPRRNSFMDHVHVPRTPIGSLHGCEGHDPDSNDVSFLTVTPSQPDPNDQTDYGSEFSLDADLDRSFALHDDPLTSQIAPLNDAETRVSASPEPPTRNLRKRQVPVDGVTREKRLKKSKDDLKNVRTVPLDELPSAGQLMHWKSQTPSVNLAVGVIAKKPTRAITTRKGTEVDLLELLVGDETRATFSVSFWLDQPDSRADVDDHLSSALDRTKPGDVLLLRSVALRSFRGEVQGQSLGKGLYRTTIKLLWRRGAQCQSEEPLYDSDVLDQVELPKVNKRRGLQSNVTLPARARAVRKWISSIIAPPPPVTRPPVSPAGDDVSKTTRRSKRSRTAPGLPMDDTPARPTLATQTRRETLRRRP